MIYLHFWVLFIHKVLVLREYSLKLLFFISDVEKERALNSLYEPMCVPDMTYIDYSQAPTPMMPSPGEDRKPQTVNTSQPPSSTTSPSNNNFLHEGKSKSFFFT